MKNYHSATSYDQIRSRFSKYITKKTDLELIDRAYAYASEKHKDQKRKNGDPYVYHLLSVANILIDFRVGPKTITCALLHDVIEDQPVTYDDIKEEFSEEIAHVVNCVTKLDGFRSTNKKLLSYANLRRLLLAMAEDIRVVIIKLADRLHNLRTLQFLSPDRRKAIAEESISVFVPIARRLGLQKMVAEMEDLSFMHFDPQKYNEIKAKYDLNDSERIAYLKEFCNEIKTKLKHENIEAIKARNKSIYSIYNKLNKLGQTEETIFDLQAVRLIVETTSDCYKVLGDIHHLFQPIQSRFKDYIATPKNNFYKSLHTVILYKDRIFEIQIRTKEMDEIAENGIAAHYHYKESKTSSKTVTKEIDDKLHLFSDLLNLEKIDENSSNAEFIQTLKTDLFESTIYAMTPAGDTFALPYGSTVLDFAYKVHTEVGNTTQGATINGQNCAIDTVLKSGDIVKIKTNSNVRPSFPWLLKVKTNSAAHKIKQYLKTHNSLNAQTNSILVGEKIYREFLDINPEFQTWLKDNKKQFNTFLKQNSIYDISHLYQLIGQKGSFNLFRFLKSNFKNINFINFTTQEETTKKPKVPIIDIEKPNLIYVQGMDNIQTDFAKCCMPIKGEKILGYVNTNGKVRIHKSNCKELQSLLDNHPEQQSKILNAAWIKNSPEEDAHWYDVSLEVVCVDRTGMMNDITSLLTNMKCPLKSINAKLNNNIDTLCFIKMTIKVQNKTFLFRIIQNLKSVPGVNSIKRVNK